MTASLIPTEAEGAEIDKRFALALRTIAITDDELARVAKASYVGVLKWRGGEPSTEGSMVAAARHLNISLNWLGFGEGEMMLKRRAQA